MSMARKFTIWVAVIAVTIVAFVGLIVIRSHRKKQSVILRGAVIKQSTDPRKQSPIVGVSGLAAGDGESISGLLIACVAPEIQAIHYEMIHPVIFDSFSDAQGMCTRRQIQTCQH